MVKTEWVRVTNGTYRTAAWSEVTILDGRSEVNFDWFEEQDACCDCVVAGVSDQLLQWSCGYCGGGEAGVRLS